MKTEKGTIIEETFFLGDTTVTIVNPNSYFPKELTNEKTKNFQQINDQNFKKTFNDLAKASRNIYKSENNFELQKNAVKKYLELNKAKTIVSEAGISYTTASLLKKNKKELDSLTIRTFEKLYKCAIKKNKII